MAVSISPGNPGAIYDPRLRATENWMKALQADLDAQAKERGVALGNKPVGNWMPIKRDVQDYNKNPHGWYPPRERAFTGVVGTFGGVRRIG